MTGDAAGVRAGERELAFDADWSMGEEAFLYIVSMLKQTKARNVVEFGSGVSTVRLAMALPEVTLISVEHDPVFVKRTQSLVLKHGVQNRVTVSFRPLAWQRFGVCFYQTYARGRMPSEIDAVIIDGPPHWTRRGREACLYQVASALNVGAMVILDDHARHDEKATVDNWMRCYSRNVRLELSDKGHGLAVVHVVGTLKKAAPVVGPIWDNYGVGLRRLRSLVRHSLSVIAQRLFPS